MVIVPNAVCLICSFSLSLSFLSSLAPLKQKSMLSNLFVFSLSLLPVLVGPSEAEEYAVEGKATI